MLSLCGWISGWGGMDWLPLVVGGFEEMMLVIFY